MRRTLRVTLSAVTIAATAALFACSSSSTGSGPSGSGSGGLTPATLRLISLASDQPGLDRVIADWAKIHPDIKIQASYFPSGDPYTTTVSTQFSGGNGSDFVWLISGHASPTSTQVFAKAGYLADLTGESWVGTMYAPTKPLYQLDNKVYVRDLGMSPLAIVNYNKDYFAKNNLQLPQTFADFLSLCQNIAGKGMTPVSWGAATQAVNANDLAVLAGNTVFANNPNWLPDAVAGKTTFSQTPGWRAAVQQIADMKSAKCFSPGVSGVALTQMISDFANSKTAMMFTYGGLVGNVLQQTPSMKVGMFPMPAPDTADTRVTVQAAGGLGINAKTQHLADAKAFLDFISTPDEQAAFAQLSNLISPVDAVSGNLTGTYTDIKSYFSGNKVLADPTAQWPNTSYNTNTGASLQGLFTGQKSVDAVLKDMDTFFAAK